MSYSMSLNIGKEGKITRENMIQVFKHNYRSLEGGCAGEHSNENIDKNRTNENGVLLFKNGTIIEPTSIKEICEEMDERLTKVKRRTNKDGTLRPIRKDAVIARTAVFQLSPEWHRENKNKEDYEEKILKYNQAYLNWLYAQVGRENILTIAFHNDETTPHLHATFIPIDEKGKLNQKGVGFIGSPAKMRDSHKSLRVELQKVGYDVDINNIPVEEREIIRRGRRRLEAEFKKREEAIKKEKRNILKTQEIQAEIAEGLTLVQKFHFENRKLDTLEIDILKEDKRKLKDGRIVSTYDILQEEVRKRTPKVPDTIVVPDPPKENAPDVTKQTHQGVEWQYGD